MTDHKFTDDEIIKALRCCKGDDIPCESCPYSDLGSCESAMAKDALALINSQKAEIERLQAVHADMTESLRLAAEANKDMQSENEVLTYKLECLLCHATGGKLSKSTYTLRTMETAVTDYIQEDYDEVKAEAIKEFAERLHEKLYGFPTVYNASFGRMIDTLVKEMTEESK